MIAGDSLTGWDGAGFQAQGLLPRNEGELQGGNMCFTEGAVGNRPRKERRKGLCVRATWKHRTQEAPSTPTQALLLHLHYTCNCWHLDFHLKMHIKGFFLKCFVSRKREAIMHALVYSLNACKDLDWTRLRLGVRNSVQITQGEWQQLNYLSSPCCLLGSALAGSWSQGAGLVCLKPESACLGSDVLTCILTAWSKAACSLGFFFKE